MHQAPKTRAAQAQNAPAKRTIARPVRTFLPHSTRSNTYKHLVMTTQGRRNAATPPHQASRETTPSSANGGRSPVHQSPRAIMIWWSGRAVTGQMLKGVFVWRYGPAAALASLWGAHAPLDRRYQVVPSPPWPILASPHSPVPSVLSDRARTTCMGYEHSLDSNLQRMAAERRERLSCAPEGATTDCSLGRRAVGGPCR